MFHVNKKRMLLEEKEIGVAKVSYFEGTCLTCQHSPDRENRAACPLAEFFTVTAYISKAAGATTTKHLCKNWELAADIVSGFRKNIQAEKAVNTPPQNPPQNGARTKYRNNNK